MQSKGSAKGDGVHARACAKGDGMHAIYILYVSADDVPRAAPSETPAPRYPVKLKDRMKPKVSRASAVRVPRAPMRMPDAPSGPGPAHEKSKEKISSLP